MAILINLLKIGYLFITIHYYIMDISESERKSDFMKSDNLSHFLDLLESSDIELSFSSSSEPSILIDKNEK